MVKPGLLLLWLLLLLLLLMRAVFVFDAINVVPGSDEFAFFG